MAFFLFPMKEGERSLDIFKIVGRLALDGTDEFNRDIDGAKGKGAELAKAVGKGLGTVAKVGAAALAAASTAMIAVGKASLDAYAEYEQLVGGVDTLFKDSSGKLQEYAAQAFMTAGMSANEYMSTATSFSASLLQGLAGDTAKAADYADMAIRDMSDNANKMGTDIARIQDAYQGFAKQNYTMLDNLKLGYGGTKTEMQRLLADANRINREHGITSNYTLDKLSDVYEAIHVVQQEMGIYGTTSEEASKTISGSLSATKAAWKNLLVGFGSDDANLGVLINNFVTSLATAAENIVPRISKILGGIGTAFSEILPILGKELPAMLQELLPGVIAGAGGLLKGLVESLPELLVVLWNALDQILGGLWNYVSLDLLGTDYDWDTAIADLKEALVNAFREIWPEIEETWFAIGEPIWELIKNCADLTAKAFGDNWPEMSRDFISFCNDVDYFWNMNLQPCLQAIGDFIENDFGPIFEAVFGLVISSAIESFVQFFDDLWNNSLLPLLTGITDFLTGVFTGDWSLAFDGLKGILGGWLEYWKSIWNLCVSFWSSVLAPVFDWFAAKWEEAKFFVELFVADVTRRWEDLKESIAEKLAEIVADVTSKFTKIKQEVESKINDVKTKVSDVFTSIKTDITEKIESARDKIRDAIEEIKGFFDFEFKWPKIPLPHFSISPSGWKVGDLLDGVIPTLGIEWYAKGGIMNDPTIFGMNGSNLMVGGEAGPEAVAPIDTLQGYVASAVASQNAMLVEALDRIHSAILNMDENMGGHMKEALDDTAFKINQREFGRLVRGVT